MKKHFVTAMAIASAFVVIAHAPAVRSAEKVSTEKCASREGFGQ